MKKLGGGTKKVLLNGCTTDSGGGGTRESLYTCMKDLGLCAGADSSYQVGYCCLHTLQLTLANAIDVTIGKGGLEERNASQAIHSFYDLQKACGFGVWELHWKDVAKELGMNSEKSVKKIAAPILTRWWTVGEAARNIVENMPILMTMSEEIRNANPSNNKLNKIASGILSLMREPIIVSDIKLIACFHDVFLNEHFDWLQKGDDEIGGTPGFLGRHMLLRYFLMHSDLSKLVDSGWKRVGEKMKPFLNSLEEEDMNVPIKDPEDPDGESMTVGKKIQIKKAEIFFKVSLTILEKHYDRFCNKFLYLSLYGEKCSSETVASILLSKPAFVLGNEVYKSRFHGGRTIDLKALRSFILQKIEDINDHLKDNVHIEKLKNCLPILACK